jgi:hypothetical protein
MPSRVRLIDTPWGRLSLAEASRCAGITPNTVCMRLARGWSVEQALVPPKRPRPRVKPMPPTKAERMARKTYRLTPEERDKVVRMYIQGLKCDYIAAVMGIRREGVSKLAIRRGVPHRMPSMRRISRAAEV